MALFKVLRGSSDDFVTDLTRADVTPPFNDGFCYFLKDTRMFYIDYAIKDSNGNIIERHRVPLNADDAKTLDNALLIRDKFSNGDNEILSAKLIHTEIARIDNLISTTIGDAITALQNNKMNKVNPTGSGTFNFNSDDATGTNAISFGGYSAKGDYSIALQGGSADGGYSFASGMDANASADFAIAMGPMSEASAGGSIAIGQSAKARGQNAVAIGSTASASGQGATAFNTSTASGEKSLAENNSNAVGSYSHSEGYGTKTTHKSQHVEGEWNELDPSSNTSVNRGVYVHITGIGTSNNNRKNGFTVDWNGNLWGARSLGHGNNISASGENAYAGGNTVVASGVSSHAEGSNNEARGSSSHTEGDSTYASSSYSHAEGKSTKATGTAAHAEGISTTASGNNSHAEGERTIASGDSSHAEGYNTIASSDYSHAEGYNTTASGGGSHAEGYCTEASGDFAHAEGYHTTASGDNSHAQNLYTIANGDAQTAMGKFNVADTTSLLIIGNGTDGNTRSNAFTVSESGIVYAQNRLNIAGLDLEQDAAGYTLFVNGPAFFSGTVKAAEPIAANDLTTKNYVDNNLPRMTHSWITATAGQSVFDFATPDDGCVAAADLTNYYYIYFNGLLLIPDLHYSVSGSVVTFIGWAAEAGDVCHIVGFKPINPTV